MTLLCFRITHAARWRVGLGAAALALGTLAVAVPLRAADKSAVESKFQLTSPAFVDGGKLPADFTCDGARASPPLEWKNAPAGTRSYALTMHHTPGPGDTHVYWVVYNLPAATHGLARSATGVGSWGINTVNGRPEYTPPCSKGPGLKTYTLTLYALSAEPNLRVPGAAPTMDALLESIQGKILGKSVLNVSYARPAGVGGQEQPRGAGNRDAGPAGFGGPEGPAGFGGPPPAGPRGMGGGRPLLAANEQAVYILRGGMLLALDAKTLKPLARAEVPAPTPVSGGAPPPAGPQPGSCDGTEAPPPPGGP